MPESQKGVPIVLTSSRTEMSVYGGDPFKAFSCTFPYKLTPYLEKYLGPVRMEDGSSLHAPYGLRKVESLLVDAFGRESVKVVHMNDLGQSIGPGTKLLGISSMDPLGFAYVSTTYNALIGIGGESRNSIEFRRVVEHPSVREHGPVVMVGGAGAWQIERAGLQEEMGIDVLFHGEAEDDLVPLVRDILDGRTPPPVHRASSVDHGKIPLALAPGTYGSVEITRGCGRGCHFCSPTMRKRHSVPLDRVLAEVDMNVRAGVRSVFMLTEDIFLYRCKERFFPNRAAVVELVREICRRDGVEEVHISHAALAPVLVDRELLPEVTPHLLERTRRRFGGRPFVTAEVGVETGSRRLMEKHMAGKALPFKARDWPEVVVQGIGHMNDNSWFPLITMITGMPDETDEDILATLELVDELRDMKAFFTPLLFIPLEDTVLARGRSVSLEALSELQFEFIARSWHNNIRTWGDSVEVPVKVRYFAPPMFIGAFLLWGRWRHGKNLTRPLLKLAGFPDGSVGGYVGKWVDEKYAVPEAGKARYRIDAGRDLAVSDLPGPGGRAGGKEGA